MVEVDEGANGREMELALDGELQISLAENPTTGFGWVIEDRAQAICDLVEDKSESGGATARGSGGVHHWRLRAKQKGEGKVILHYKRSWEAKAPSRTFSLNVRVT